MGEGDIAQEAFGAIDAHSVQSGMEMYSAYIFLHCLASLGTASRYRGCAPCIPSMVTTGSSSQRPNRV